MTTPDPNLEPPSVLDPPTVLPPPPPFSPQPATAAVPGGEPGVSGAPTAELDAVGPRPGRPMRLRTVVFGLVLLAVAASTLAGSLTGARISPSLVAVAVLVGAGFVLVAGGLSAALRESAGRPPH